MTNLVMDGVMCLVCDDNNTRKSMHSSTPHVVVSVWWRIKMAYTWEQGMRFNYSSSASVYSELRKTTQ